MESLEAEIKERIEMIGRGEVPEGYKEKLDRIIPADWDIKKLHQLVNKIVGGGTPSRSKPHYFNGDIPWATVKDLSEDNYKRNTLESISREGLRNSTSKVVEKNNFIISTRMGLGRGFINKVDMAINQDLKGLYPNKSKVDVIYLMYWYKYNSIIVERLGVGSTVKGINLKTLRNMLIPHPPLSEQQKIAQTLTTWDEVIELKEKLIEEKKEQKKGLMQKLLTGDVRLPGFDGEWEEVRLREVLFFPKKEAVQYPQEYYLLTVKLHLNGVEATDKKPNKTKRSRPYYIRKPKELLIGRQNFHNGGIGIVPDEMENYIASNAISSLNAKKGDIKFYYFYLSNANFYKKIGHIIGGTGQKEISETELKNLKLTIPKYIQEQKAIAQILSTADKEIDLLEEELELLKLQKKGLMQLLLTGIIRVKC